MTDPHGVCAKRAENLRAGVSYVKGWAEGRRGADALAEPLRFAGLAAEIPGLKADVNENGEGVVSLGAIRPAVAVRLAALLAAGITAELMQQWARELPHTCETPGAPMEARPADE